MGKNMPLATLSTFPAFPIPPLNTEGLHAQHAFGIVLSVLLGTLLLVAGPGVSGSDLSVPGGVAGNASGFEQTRGFQGLFRDAAQATATLAPLAMPIPEGSLKETLPEPPHLSSLDRRFFIFNIMESLQRNLCRDNNGNLFSITQSAPLTQVQLQVPGSGNRLEITQTGRGASTALQLSGDANRVDILQSGPETQIKMKVQAHAADLSVQQGSKGATFIFSGTLDTKGVMSVNQ